MELDQLYRFGPVVLVFLAASSVVYYTLRGVSRRIKGAFAPKKTPNTKFRGVVSKETGETVREGIILSFDAKGKVVPVEKAPESHVIGVVENTDDGFFTRFRKSAVGLTKEEKLEARKKEAQEDADRIVRGTKLRDRIAKMRQQNFQIHDTLILTHAEMLFPSADEAQRAAAVAKIKAKNQDTL